MARIPNIVEFNNSDGLTPMQVRKLNYDFQQLAQMLHDLSLDGSDDYSELVDAIEALRAYVEEIEVIAGSYTGANHISVSNHVIEDELSNIRLGTVDGLEI